RVASPTPATPDTSTLSLHDALPISASKPGSTAPYRGPSCAPSRSPRPPAPTDRRGRGRTGIAGSTRPGANPRRRVGLCPGPIGRSEEHTSELQSRVDLVCRLLLEKK